MERRTMWTGLALVAACAIAVAGTAIARGVREPGAGPGGRGDGPMMEMPGPDRGPTMEMPGPGGLGPMTWSPGPGVLERLDLSEAQRRRVADLRDEEERKVIRLEADLRIARLDLRRLVEGERPSLQAIGAHADRIADLRGGILKARLATRIALRELLTPQQRARLREAGPGMRPGPRRAGEGGDVPRGPHGPRGAGDGGPPPDDDGGGPGPDAR